jgi:integrase
LIDAGIDVVKISRRLGHASVDTTLRIYAHLFRKRDDKSSAAINAAVASLFQGFSIPGLLYSRASLFQG